MKNRYYLILAFGIHLIYASDHHQAERPKISTREYIELIARNYHLPFKRAKNYNIEGYVPDSMQRDNVALNLAAQAGNLAEVTNILKSQDLSVEELRRAQLFAFQEISYSSSSDLKPKKSPNYSAVIIFLINKLKKRRGENYEAK